MKPDKIVKTFINIYKYDEGIGCVKFYKSHAGQPGACFSHVSFFT